MRCIRRLISSTDTEILLQPVKKPRFAELECKGKKKKVFCILASDTTVNSVSHILKPPREPITTDFGSCARRSRPLTVHGATWERISGDTGQRANRKSLIPGGTRLDATTAANTWGPETSR